METDPTDLRSQDRRRAAADDARRRARLQALDDVQRLMENTWGRRFVWRLLDFTGVFRSSMTGSSETYFREGMRNVGLMLLADVHDVCPDLYIEMLHEQRGKHDRPDSDAVDRAPS